MESQSLPVNLRLLCSYVGSVSECSRKMGINRQQLSKYLNGYSQPSMQTLRKICDYFGVDSDEIYLEPEQFKDLISTQKKASLLIVCSRTALQVNAIPNSSRI